MSDLISRKAVMKLLSDKNKDGMPNDARGRAVYNFIEDTIDEIRDGIPTAYDVDKVVEKLEEKAKKYQYRIDIRKGECYFDESQKIHDLNERLLGLEQGIEIVKEGITNE